MNMKQTYITLLFLLVALLPLSAQTWDGARWIGTADEDQSLYSHYLTVFRLKATLTLPEGSSQASIIYGANDSRLLSANNNPLGMKSPRDHSMIKVELALVDDSAELRIFRTGYAPTDRQDKPYVVFRISRQLISRHNAHVPHTLEVASNLGESTFRVDGTNVGEADLNPLGKGGDFIAFPALGDIGVSVPHGQEAVFTDISIWNYRSPYGKITDIPELCGPLNGGTRIINPTRNSLPLLRTAFTVDRPVAHAHLRITARGVYDACMNGRLLTKEYLNPGFTQYNKTHLYRDIDVTEYLRKGTNVLGVQLAEGWWMGAMTYQGQNWNYFGDRLSLLCSLTVDYTDGNKQVIVSRPEEWQYTTASPVREASLFQGEVYDARKADKLAGWDTMSDKGISWKPAMEVPLEGHISKEGWGSAPAPDDYSQWQLIEDDGDRIDSVMTLTAVSLSEPRPGVWVYDMGQNMVGVPLIRFRGLESGTEVNLRFAEVTYPDMPAYWVQRGMVMMENIRAAMAQDRYIARGGDETFSPRLTTHGYRYIEVTGIPRPLPLADVQGIVLSSAGPIRAHYETSDSLVNRLWQNIVWSTRGNFLSIPTDCPQRNERMGWAGDISVYTPTAVYLTDCRPLLHRYLHSMRDGQDPDGRFPDIAPVGGGFGGFLWGSAGITVPWAMYRQWADTLTLQEHYPAMKRYIRYVFKHYMDPDTRLLVQHREWGDLGDWLGPLYEQDDKSLIWEAYLIHDLDLMARVADVLGKTGDAAHYRQMAAERRLFFQQTYIDRSSGKTIASAFLGDRAGTEVDTPTSYVLPLAFHIVDGRLRDSLICHLTRTLHTEQKMDNGQTAPPYSLLTGFIGTGWISPVLSDCGHIADAYRLLLAQDYPSWLYPVCQGATTIWERLNSYTREEGFGGNNRMNSFNHYSFGAVGYWLIAHSLGIRCNEQHPGFSHVILRPEPDPTGHLSFARGYYDSPHGRIESSWERVGKKIIFRFTVPSGITATLILPGAPPRPLPAGRHQFVRRGL